MKYTVDHFIEKFKAIPADKWTWQEFTGNNESHCALGHCGVTGQTESLYEEISSFPEAKALYTLVEDHGMDIMAVNDGEESGYQQLTPKERVMQCLADIKLVDQKIEKARKPKERIVYVGVPEAIKEMEVVLN